MNELFQIVPPEPPADGIAQRALSRPIRRVMETSCMCACGTVVSVPDAPGAGTAVTRADVFAAALGAADSPRVPLALGSTALAIVASALPQTRQLHAADVMRQWAATRPEAAVVTAPPAAQWPFIHPLVPPLPAGALIVWVPDLHEAVINRQTASTRLVTTQAAYLMQVWLDALAGRDDVLLVATADPDALAEHAPEVIARRGPFASPLLHVDSAPGPRHPESAGARQDPQASCGEASPQRPDGRQGGADAGHAALGTLAAAMRSGDPAQRLSLCVSALEHGRTPGALLAAGSVCMEVNDLDAAARDLNDALAQAPEWAAAHFERGKLWLRVDDMERAGESFRAAAARMPAFASAWANLGATLGELDRPEEALAAFERALHCDPTSHQALNNIGVVHRELGKLADSESAFHRVTQLAPALAFGYYNLGHTLFLQGRYHAALSAYIEGQKRDAERNPVQASRLALCRLAAGDATGALNDLQRATAPLPRAYKQQLLADTHAIAWALLTHRPDLAGWKQVNDWLTNELARA